MIADDVASMLVPIRDGIETIQGILAGGIVTPADVQRAIDERVEPLEARVSRLERARWVWGAVGLLAGAVLARLAL